MITALFQNLKAHCLEDKILPEALKLKIIRRKSRYLTLQFENSKLLLVRVPEYYTKENINEFLLKKDKWINKIYNKLIEKEALTLFDPEKFVWFGYKLDIEYDPSMANRVNISMDEKRIIAGFKLDSPENRAAVYKKTAHIYLKPKTLEIANSINLKPAKIIIRGQKTKWGTCSNKGNISLNWKMMLAPQDVIKYIIIHELSHLVHHNHGAQFKQMVEKLCPDVKKHQEWLALHSNYLKLY